MNRGVTYALTAAALFGASTPLARSLVGAIDPLWLAGILYAGSGVGLLLVLAVRHWGGAGAHRRVASIAQGDVRWLAATAISGGVVAPVLFTFGLRDTSGAAASLLLNLETVLTVVIAWFVFREHRNARVVAGMAFIVVACAALGGGGDGIGRVDRGALLIALACLFWALDNNLTRKVAANDAMLVAATKGVIGGTVNLCLAALLAGAAPPMPPAAAAGVVGLLGYGVSLMLFVLALRELGVARASAYFATAPFIGVAVAFGVLGERPGPAFWVALPLMAIGVWLHLTERHGHAHAHERLLHEHPHRHDEHHRHLHGLAWDGTEPHAHPHEHDPVVHTHSHFPDLHHRHGH
jgi:drug/metabolite transporter (DMT)-like permease